MILPREINYYCNQIGSIDFHPPRNGTGSTAWRAQAVRAAGGSAESGRPVAASGSSGSSATCSRHHGLMARLPSSTPARKAAQSTQVASSTSAGSGASGVAGGRDEDRAHLVLDDPVGHHRAVAERGEQQRDALRPDADLVEHAAPYGVRHRLAGAGVPADTVGPGARPGRLGQRPLGHQQPAVRGRTGSRRTPGAAGCRCRARWPWASCRWRGRPRRGAPPAPRAALMPASRAG